MNDLLDKYFDGQTSLEEENRLICYFRQDDIAEEHKPYTLIFRFLAEERQLLSTDLPEEKKGKIKPVLFRAISIAACFIAVIATGTLIWLKSFDPVIEQSLVYIDGKRVVNEELFLEQALNSINQAVDIDSEILNTQIDMLNMFTE